MIETEDDEAVIRKSQLEPEAFRTLYEKYFAKIFVFVHNRIGEKSLTADITSQVFLKALMNIRKFQFRGLPFSSWLYRIATNECHEFFRSHKRFRMVALSEDTVENLYDELTADSGLEAWHEKLPAVLEHLDEDELLIIELRFFERRAFKEVGEILGISEVNAKVKLYRALGRMKKLFLEV